MRDAKHRFIGDVADHVMEVFRDDGVHRHIRFRKPGTMCMHFDLITWPGYLCYTGDMGTYVFRRLEDMFTFFRPSAEAVKRGPLEWIDRSYWAEKLEASDKGDGHSEFDPAAFQREITRQRRVLLVENTREWSTEDRRDLWESLEDVKSGVHDGEHRAFAAVWDWSFRRGHRDLHLSTDDFPRCQRYTFRFEWCCYALRWAVMKYDAARAETEVAA